MNKTLLVLFLLTFISCVDCKSDSNTNRDSECLMIVTSVPAENNYGFDFKGIHPVTSEKCSCVPEDNYRWWNSYRNLIHVGDTIIKRKGELIFHIHKKDTILIFSYECEGKIYK